MYRSRDIERGKHMNRIGLGRRVAAAAAVIAVMFAGMPGASAETDVPAYGSITIADAGLGPRATWTYDGLLDCGSLEQGPGGVPQVVTVTCYAGQSAVSLSCPLMIVTRTTLTVVGARATCGSTLDMGVGTSGAASANLGHVSFAIVCVAYVDFGVLVPPYSVTCNEPGLPIAASLPVGSAV
jgi:hypothetical protein